MEFLKLVAKDIYQKQEQGEQFTLIFPNARSIKYFKRYYAQLIDSPQVISLVPWQSFLDRSLGMEQASHIELIFLLYKSFRKILGSRENFKDYTLDKFFSLGETILSDFNEVDNYLIDPQKIFVNIADLETLWTTDYLTDEQKEAIERLWSHYKGENLSFFKELFAAMFDIYKDFRSRLAEKKIVYTGLRNRLIVERLHSGEDLFKDIPRPAFVGFYALSASEREIMKFLQKNHNALFYWDLDKAYYEDPLHEAGLFLRKNIKDFPNELDSSNFDNLLQEKNLKIVSAPQNVAQAKAIPWVLRDLGINGDNKYKLASTVIVLLDESMLFPVLYSLPEYVDNVNITLQFPFYLTSLYAFFDKWIYLLRQFIVVSKVYYKDFLQLIKTEIARKYFPDFVESFSKKLAEKQILSIQELDLKDVSGAEDLFLFNKENASLLLEHIRNVIFQMLKKADDFDREYLYYVYNQLGGLISDVESFDEAIDVLMSLHLLSQILYSVRVPFQGESEEALQIMTIMETRNLDFENVIIVGMNEGVFPKITRGHSFFSEFIRRAYGLPVISYRDALYSYIFYRLIQRASNVYLIYNSVPSQGVEGPSRYLLQLEKDTNLISQHIVFTDEITIPGVGEVFQLPVLEYRPEYISVSAINDYIECPRRFFYKHIIKLPEPQDLDLQEFDHALLGTMVHSVLEKIYSTIARRNNHIIDAENLNAELQKIDQYIDEFIDQNKDTAGMDFYSGVNKLKLQVVKDYVRKVIKFDLDTYVPFEIISLEKDKLSDRRSGYSVEFSVTEDFSLSLYGIFDRVDKKDFNGVEVIRICDYKTGKKETKFRTVEELFGEQPNSSVFQLLFYKYMVKGIKDFSNKVVVPFLYSIPRLLDSGYTGYLTTGRKNIYHHENIIELDEIIMPDFETRLKDLLRKIIFEDKEFPKTEDSTRCTYCPYKDLCGIS